MFLRGGEAIWVLEPPAREGKAARLKSRNRGLALRMSVQEGNPGISPVTGSVLPGRVSYFRGSNPRDWRAGISTFGKVTYPAVRPGLDLVYYARPRALEYDLVLQPGISPSEVRLQFTGADCVRETADGGLEFQVGARALTHQRPIAYQEVNGQRRPVKASFRLASAAPLSSPSDPVVAGFELGSYDASRPLVIDPVVTASSYLGGSGYDEGSGIGVDAQGNTYLAGITSSVDFPGAGLPAHPTGGSDSFVAKFSADGQSLLYAAYLGGDDSDVARALAVLPDGTVTVAGSTFSSNFPVVAGAQDAAGGGLDGYVSRINPAGNALIYSTYLGGSADDLVTGVGVDGTGGACVSGTTFSADFPTVNALQPTRAGTLPRSDAFIARLAADGTPSFSTYLGGSGHDGANGIACNPSGRIWITGYTESLDFPLAAPMQSTRTGAEGDAFVASLPGNGTSLLYSTYLGGSGGDVGQAIAVDAADHAYVAGVTESANFPSPADDTGHQHLHGPGGIGVLHTGFNGGEGDAFVARLHKSGRTLEYSHLMGGVGFETALGIGVDAIGRAQVVGFTDSVDIPQLHPVQPGYGGGQRDAFLIGVNSRGTAHTYVSYLGGSSADRARAIVVLPSGEARLTGETSSNDFLNVEAWQDHLAGATQFGGDAFVTVMQDPTPPPALTQVTAALRSRRAIRLQWEDQSDDETSFVVERSDSLHAPATVGVVEPNVVSFEDEAVQPDRLYTYRVFSVNAAGRSHPSASSQALISPLGRLSVSASRVNFGTVRIGASRRKVVRLRNTGTGSLTVWVDSPSAPFSQAGESTLTLGSRASVEVAIDFAPSGVPGAARGEVRLRTSDPKRPVVRVKLSGKAVPAAAGTGL